MMFMVSQTAAVAIFTITRLFYSSVIGYIVLILFSKLPGGSAAKFWYEQPDLVSKITSLFDPFDPTGKRGVKTTNAIAMLSTILALSLNILPTFLSKLSPIMIEATVHETNSTLSPISNMFIPTLTDINLPGLSHVSTSRNATNRFLCTYLRDGCLDATNTRIADINWDPVQLEPIAFYHPDSETPNSLTVHINESFGTTEQYMFIARQVFNSTSPFSGESIGQWTNNNLTGFYSIPNNDISIPLEILHADQLFPLVTSDITELLHQGKRNTMYMPTDGGIDRAERWVAVHRNLTLSSLLWQTVNAHQGTIGSEWQTSCFFCSILDIPQGSAQADLMQDNLISSATLNETRTFVIHSYVDNQFRLSTTLCLLQLNQSTQALSYYCLHTYSQIWSVSHVQNPYNILHSYETHDPQLLVENGTPFPLFPPPELVNNRTYFPTVPIFQIRSKGQCDTNWNFQTQSIQSWFNTCAQDNLGQVDTLLFSSIARNIWQLSSTITVGGFLVNATYYENNVGIGIGVPVIIIVFSSVILCLVFYFVTILVTSPIHRRSLYETMRVMVPSSSDPYNVRNMVLDVSPTNTLRLVDSIYDKKVSYLKLNNRLIVALSEDHEVNKDDASIDVNMSPLEVQKWSRRKLVNF